jgi:hypothetical protein
LSKRAKILVIGVTVAVSILASAMAVLANGGQPTSRAGRTPEQERAASRGIAQAKEVEGEVRAMEDANAEGLGEAPLPPRDAEGYIEGPVEYTDHGLRIHLSAEQASNPVKETEGDLYLQVRPKEYTRRPAVQSPEETREMSDSELRDQTDTVLTVHLKTSDFQNPSDSSCTSQAIPEATGITAQICTLGSVSGAEVLDESANLLATQLEGNPTMMYREMVEVLPALAAEQSESTPTTSTESAESTPTTSTPEPSAAPTSSQSTGNPCPSNGLQIRGEELPSGAGTIEALTSIGIPCSGAIEVIKTWIGLKPKGEAGTVSGFACAEAKGENNHSFTVACTAQGKRVDFRVEEPH